jgi:protein SCO1/2
MNGAGDALLKAGLKMGKDYQIITVSIDPNEGPELAKNKKKSYIAKYGPEVAHGWHFLTGPQGSIQKLADVVGFHYRYDSKGKQFLHASGIMVLTPKGKLSHYFYGITYPFRDIRLSLVEASAGKIGSLADQVLLFCCSIDLTTGKYTASIFRIIQLVCISIALSLGVLLYVLHTYEPKKV